MALTEQQKQTVDILRSRIREWIDEEGRARSTLAGAVVVVDALRQKAPITHEDVFTPGGQLSGGRGSSLRDTLMRYGEDRVLLADGVTTRSTSKFERLAEALSWGKDLSGWSEEDRDEASKMLAEPILAEIDNYFRRQHLSVAPDRSESPTAWIELILEQSRSKSQGRVEQHLIGAKLECRFPEADISAHAAFAADVQTERPGDFALGKIVFHVTAAPAPPVINKCKDNLRRGLQPVLVVPRDSLDRAKGLAAFEEGLDRRITFVAIEDFLASNILELSGESGRDFIDVLKSIIEIYNRRIEETETDVSLRIEIR